MESTSEPVQSPLLKRRRTSDAKYTSAAAGGEHFFCGVKVKQEPVGFGCADCLDDVVEVRVSSEEDTKSSISVVPSMVPGGGGVDADDDEISYVGGNMTTMLEMPHARESCSQFPFVKPIPGVFNSPSPANLKFCDYCYCYVCEGKAADCLYWSTHAQANHKNVAWKVERALLRSKLLLQLNPPTRRAKFIQNILKPNITDSDQAFKKVLDDMKSVVMVLFEEKYASKLQQVTDADFLEPIILLTNILKKCQNDLREHSAGYRAMLYLSQALLSTKMFTASFALPDMVQAIKEDLISLSNGIALEFVEVLLHLTTRSASSMVDWVHEARLDNRCDVPIAVGKVKSSLVSLAIFTALKDVHACPAAVLEFCYRQGDRLTAQCFYWLIQSNYLDVAKVAIDRIPQANVRRELCQQYVEERPNKKSSILLKFSALLAVIAPKYDSILSGEDLLCFYIGKMFPRNGAVDVQAAAVYNSFSKEPAGRGSLLPYVESLKTTKSVVVTAGRGVVSVSAVPPGGEVSCLFFLLLSFPFFAPSFIAQKVQQLKRILSQVVLKDAGMNCKLVFLYYFQAWGSLLHTDNRVVLTDTISALTSDIARDVISREPTFLLKMPQDTLRHWGAVTHECNLAEIFTPLSFTKSSVGVYSIKSNAPPSLKMAASSSYVPLYLFSTYLKEKSSVTHLSVLMPLMWKSYVVTSIDYIINSNRFKMSNLMMFMQLLLSFDVGEKLTIMLREIVVMLHFFEAVLALSSPSAGVTDADNYRLTKLLRGIVKVLKDSVDNDQGRWLFWQALLSQILKKVVGENKYDVLNFLIIEDWATLQNDYFSEQRSTVTYTSKFKALLLSKPSDVDIRNKSACVYLWQRICAVSPQLINTLADSTEPTLLNSLLLHATDNMVDITPYLQSPAILRTFRAIVDEHINSEAPEEIVWALKSKWDTLKTIACEKMDALFQNKLLEPSRTDVLLAVVLKLTDTFAHLFPRLLSTQDHLTELFRQCATIEETTFLTENTIATLRHAILNNPTFRQRLSQVFQQLDFFSALHQVSSLSMIQVLALLFPSAQTITSFMSQKDRFDDERVTQEVFSHFQNLLINDFEGSNISIADAFQLYVQFSDENSVKVFFLSLYTKKINPLVCKNFISYCFAHMTHVGHEKCGMILSWLVAFCYRFHQDVSREVLCALQENLLAFSSRVDCNYFHLSDNNSKSNSSSCSSSSSNNNSGSGLDSHGNTSISSSEGLNVTGGSSDEIEAVAERCSLTVHEVYYSLLEVAGEDTALQLLHPKYAFNFLQLIIFPQSERYDMLPIHLLSPLDKRITLHFLFDIENPMVFLSTALKSEEFASVNEKFVQIPFTNPHWPNILTLLLSEIRSPASEGEGKGEGGGEQGGQLTSPLKKSRGAGSFPASKFLCYALELLVMMQVMLCRDVSASASNLIKSVFYHFDALLFQPSDRCILKNVMTFKSSDILHLIEEEQEKEKECSSVPVSPPKPSKLCEQIARLCFFSATAKWSRPLDKISRYIELGKLSLHIKKIALQESSMNAFTVPSFSSIFQKVNFRPALSPMMESVLSSQVLNLLDSSSERDEMAYVNILQALISIVRSENSNIVMTLLPSIAECLDSKFLRKAMTSFHVTSGYVSSTLWTQLINEISNHVDDPCCVSFMKFLCHVSNSLHTLTPTAFLTAAASAAQNLVLPRWLVVLSDVIIVEDIQQAQAVASLLLSIPKEGDLYSLEFWRKMYTKITYYDVTNLAIEICTESRCSDASFLTGFFSHSEIVNALSVDLDGAKILEEPNQGLIVLWGCMVQRDDTRIVAMMKKAVYYLLNERLTQHKKLLLTNFLPKMRSLFYKAGKVENWRNFCLESAGFCGKKKPLVLILMEAVSPPCY